MNAQLFVDVASVATPFSLNRHASHSAHLRNLFFCVSLRALVPGDDTEAVLARLAGAQLHMAQLTPRPPEPPTSDPSGFAVQAIIMYQNEYLLPARIGRDGKPFTDYFNALRNAAQEHFKTLPKGDGRAMMLTICIKPDRRARFWFTFRSEPLTDPATDSKDMPD